MSRRKGHQQPQSKPKEAGPRLESEGLLQIIGKGELITGIVLALVPWGLSLIGIAINILLGGAILLFAFYLVAHYFWRRTAQWRKWPRVACIGIAFAIVSVVVGGQMLAQYRIQHPIPAPEIVLRPFPQRLLTADEQARFVRLLGDIKDNETLILRCPSNDEQACSFANQFVGLFKSVGWPVDGERVSRIEPNRLGQGVVLLKRGLGSGSWVSQTPSLLTIKGTLSRIGVATGMAADADVQDDQLGISFGPGPYDRRELTLIELFEDDIPQTMRLKSDYSIIYTKGPKRGNEFYYRFQIYLDWPARSKFIGFYLPAQVATPADMLLVARNRSRLLADMERKFWTQAGRKGDEPMDMRDLVFSGQVFIYYEGILSPREKTVVIEAYRKIGLNPQFRGLDYLSDRRVEQKASSK